MKDESNPGDTRWWYSDGSIWSHFLWDLRDRAADLKNQLPTLGIDEHAVEDLQFEALTRMDAHVRDYTESLEALLDADAAATGRQLSYDILSSAARHGIKLDQAIAAAEPNRWVFEQQSNGALVEYPSFTVYTGANDDCLLEFTTEASLLRHPEGYDSDPRYAALRCSAFPNCLPGVIPAALDPAGVPRDYENRRFKCTMPELFGTLLNSAQDPGSTTIILYNVTSTGPLGDIDGVVRGAGTTYKDPDYPAIFVVPEGEAPCGACAASGSKSGDVSAALLAVAAFAVIRFRRKPM